MRIKYSGWSSFSLDHCEIFAGFDVFGRGVEDVGFVVGNPYHLFISHGHPEHCGHINKIRRRDHSRQLRLYSSEPVLDFVRSFGLTEVQLHGLSKNPMVTESGLCVASFEWKHMPLLPPESVGAKIRHLLQLARHPLRFVSEFVSGLGMPIRAPTIGFHLRFPDGTTVLNYAEGLHRLTLADEVERVARQYPSDILLAGVEREDREVIPRWIKILNPRTVVLFEPHGPWRSAFGFPETPLREIGEGIQKLFPEKKVIVCESPGTWELS